MASPSPLLPQDPHSPQSLTVIEEGKEWNDPADPSCCSCLCFQVLESRLQQPLPEDLAEALANGVILCQLANQLRPRSVPFIHVPSPAVVSGSPKGGRGEGTGLWLCLSKFLPFLLCLQPKLSALKSRKNVESFLEACRKMGVPEVWGCTLLWSMLVARAQLKLHEGRRSIHWGVCSYRKHVSWSHPLGLLPCSPSLSCMSACRYGSGCCPGL